MPQTPFSWTTTQPDDWNNKAARQFAEFCANHLELPDNFSEDEQLAYRQAMLLVLQRLDTQRDSHDQEEQG